HLHPAAPALREELNDYQLPRDVVASELPNLPAFVQQAYPDALSSRHLSKTMGLPLVRFVSAGGRSFERGRTTVGAWRAAGVERIVLIGTQKDRLLDHLWLRRASLVNA